MNIDTILDALHDDILITDGEGKVVKVSATFESVYGISKEKALGLSVYEMEEQGFFKPSVTALVLKTGEKITMRQKNNRNRDIVVTATPVKAEDGNIQLVVSFSRDITDFLLLQEQYKELEHKVSLYQDELVLLRSENTIAEGVIAKSESMKKLLSMMSRIAPFDANILLTGESGVGKSLMAKLVHKKSKRADGPFIDINCGAIPENLLESELFGYEKGSFTGAGKDGKVGLIELAQNGTLFLDEISELPLNLQVKILKVIQEKTIIRVGGTKEILVDFRLISASNKNLTELMKSGAFREDLYYRLNVISLNLPPLRERREDLIPLLAHFVEKFNAVYGLKKSLSKDAYRELTDQQWPGNIRELENTIEKVLLTSENDLISGEDIRDSISPHGFYFTENTESTRPVTGQAGNSSRIETNSNSGTHSKGADLSDGIDLMNAEPGSGGETNSNSKPELCGANENFRLNSCFDPDSSGISVPWDAPVKLNEALETLEADLIRKSYKKHGTTVAVANELGISQPTAYRKIKKYLSGTFISN